MFEMIRGQRPILRRERRSMLVRELLCVQANPEAVMGGGLEQALDLVRRERDRLAKSVDAGCNALFRSRGNQLVDDLADIMGAAIALIGRKRVEREKGRNHAYRFLLTEIVRDLQQPQFAFWI